MRDEDDEGSLYEEIASKTIPIFSKLVNPDVLVTPDPNSPVQLDVIGHRPHVGGDERHPIPTNSPPRPGQKHYSP